MTYLSIIEKLKILFNTLLDFKFILVFTILLLIFSFLYVLKKLSVKKYTVCMLLSFIIVFAISIINNYEILSNTFDDFFTILFGNIYFPSIYVYISVLVISLISFIVSMLNTLLKKSFKVINSIMFIINNILLVIILNIIAKNKIDIFSVNSLYSNTTLVAILELSMNIFILWLLSLITVYITNCICERIVNKKIYDIKVSKEKTIFNPVLEVNIECTNSEESLISTVPAISSINETVGINDIELTEGVIQNISDNNHEIEKVIEDNDTIANEVDINDEVNTVIVENIETFEESMVNDIILTEDTIQNISDNNLEIEEAIKVNDTIINKDNSIIEVQEEYKSEPIITFNDILNGTIPVTYYDNNVREEKYELINPQIIYENKYNVIKNEEVTFKNVNIELENNINNTIELSVEEKTLIEKEKAKEERLTINTISLNDLINDEENDNNDKLELSKISLLEEITTEKVENIIYTLEDYKKIINMLNSIKMQSNGNDITIDDAIALSLINDYSIDDCMKFKNILESNLN